MPRARKVDELLLAASDIVAGWIRHATIPEERIAGVVHRLHVQLTRMNDRTYTAWEEATLPPDVLDAVDKRAGRDAAVPAEIKVYPPPMHPLAAPGTPAQDKIDGTVTPEKITCLECRRPVALMKTHLKAKHDGMTWPEYLDRHSLPADYPAAAPNLSAGQSEKTKRFRNTGERIPEDQLVRKRAKKKGDLKGKGTVVEPDFFANNPRSRDAGGDDELGRTG